MGNAQPQPQLTPKEKFFVIRQSDGSTIVVSQSKLMEIFNQSK